MFERYSEQARRVVFFARYEASNYGSTYIETEYLLLGLLRENRGLVKCLPGEKDVESGIRTEIEKQITKGKRIPVSVEVPLSADCKKVLILAAESAERLGQRRVEPEHILIGSCGSKPHWLLKSCSLGA